jgi:hypothetical protein
LSLVETNKAQNEPCTKLNLSFDKVQIDTIKDNIKDNMGKECCLLPSGNKQETAAGAAVSSTNQKSYKKVSKQWLEDNKVEYKLTCGNLGFVVATGALIELT